MVAAGEPIPHRIKPDAIVEAITEVRFDSVAPLPEILIGRFAESPHWKGYAVQRLSAFHIPAAIRESDKNLRFSPILEFRGDDNRRLLRVGPHALSFHLLAPYGGWGNFFPLVAQAISDLFAFAERVVVSRIGIRYINALTRESHGINGLEDLDISVSVSQRHIASRLGFAFVSSSSEESTCVVKVNTNERPKLKVAENATVVVDTDTYTPDAFEASSRDAVVAWIERSRQVKNIAFLSLFKRATLDRLGGDK